MALTEALPTRNLSPVPMPSGMFARMLSATMLLLNEVTNWLRVAPTRTPIATDITFFESRYETNPFPRASYIPPARMRLRTRRAFPFPVFFLRQVQTAKTTKNMKPASSAVVSSGPTFDFREALVRFLKYTIEGLAVGTSAMLMQQNPPTLEEAIILSVIASATFSIIDLFAPSLSPGMRLSTGAKIGAQLYPGAW